MAISCEESDGKEESARDCCTTLCDKSCLQNASHSRTQALQAAGLHAPPPSSEIEDAEEAEASSPAAPAAAAEAAHPSLEPLAISAPEPLASAASFISLQPEYPPPSPSLLLPNCDFDSSADTHQNVEDDTAAAENICAPETNSPDEQSLLNLSTMALLNQSPSSNSKRPNSNFPSSPPSSTTSFHVNDQATTNKIALSRHSQQQEQAFLFNDNASIRNSQDLFSSVANSLDPNAREFIPSCSSSSAIPQQDQMRHSYTPFQADMGSLYHQMGSMANYEPVLPNHEQNHTNHDMGTAFYMDPEVDYSYLGFHQKPEGAYENHGYGVYQAASHILGFPVAPGGVLANPAPLHNMGLPTLPPTNMAPSPSTSPSPSPLIAASPFMSVPPAGVMQAQLSSALHSQRQYPPFYGYGSSKEHVSRALLITGLPHHHNEAQVREELERWGTIRSIQAQASPAGLPPGLQIRVQFFDLRAARQALRDMQNLYQQSHELHTNSLYKHQYVGIHNEGITGNGRRGLLCGNVVSAQYIAAWTMEVPDSHNQGTLVLFNVGADVNMQDLRRVFEAYGNVREVREAPTKRIHKFVEFYDTRSAAAAWTALNGQEICGKCVKIEFSRQGGAAARRQKVQADKEMIAASSNAGAQIQVPINMDPFSWNGDMIASSNGLQGFINGGPYHQGWEIWPSHDGFSSHIPVNVCTRANLPNTLPIPNVTSHQAERYCPGRFLGGIGALEPQHVIPSGLRRGQQLHSFDPEFRQVASHCAGGAAGHGKDRHMGGSRHLKGDTDFKFDEDEMHSRPSNARTTLMIRNIPNKYSQKMLLSMLDQYCLQFSSKLGINEPEAAYDFMYLPIDFKNKCNLGYAFVNFTTPQATLGFYKIFNGKAWEEFNSRKICEVACARLQGRPALEEHFRTSRFACDTEEYLPVLFVPPRNGANLSQPRVAVGQLGIVRGYRTGSGGHGLYPHSISNELPDSPPEQNEVPPRDSNSESSSGCCEAEELLTEGLANTSDALDKPPTEMGV